MILSDRRRMHVGKTFVWANAIRAWSLCCLRDTESQLVARLNAALINQTFAVIMHRFMSNSFTKF